MSFTSRRDRLYSIVAVVKKNTLHILLLQAFLVGLVLSIHGTVFQPFILTLIPSLVIVGLLQSIFNFGAFFLQLFGGHFSDRLGRKKALSIVFLFSSIMGIIFLAIVLFQPLDPLWTLIMLTGGTLILSTGIAFYRTSGLAVAIDSSENSTSETKLQNTGLILGFFLFAEFGSGIFGPIIASVSAERGFQFTYLIILVISIIGFLLTLAFFKSSSNNASIRRPKQSIRSYLGIRPSLRFYYLATSVDSIGWSLLLGIWFSLLIKYHSYTIADLAIISIVISTVLGIGQIPGGWLADRIKKNYLLGFSNMLGIIALLIWIVSQQLMWVALGYVFLAISITTWVPTVYSYLGEKVTKEERAFEIGKWSAYRGLITLPMPLIGGFLAEVWNFYAPMFATLVIVIIAMILYFRIKVD
ncbi:MAG: MFS transporter [Promethearchaeota archaeon]